MTSIIESNPNSVIMLILMLNAYSQLLTVDNKIGAVHGPAIHYTRSGLNK